MSSVTILVAASSPFAKLFAKPSISNVTGTTFQYRTFSVDHVKEVKSWFDDLRKKKKLGSNANFQSYIGFEFDPEKILPGAKSVIVITRRFGMASVTFNHQGREIAIIIPSEYWDDGVAGDAGKNFIKNEVFNGRDVTLERTKLPLKTIAVRSGLAEYGLNNITFVKDFGSYHLLGAYYTTEKLPDQWGPLKTMRFCRGCSICKKTCPTQCIKDDEFVIDIDHCLTLYNELPDPFPGWLPASAHHTLVGCLKCQWDCPGNAGQNSQVQNIATLSEEETAFILTTETNEKLQKQIHEKLKLYPSVADFDYFRRNAGLALKNLINS